MSSLTFHKIEKILPYNFLAERLVLGSMLTKPVTIPIVSQYLNIETFYLESHQNIYKGILLLFGQGKKVDYFTLTTWLQDNELSNYIEDLSLIVDFVNQFPSITFLEDYLALVYEKYLRRLLIDLGYGIIESGYSTEIPVEKIFSIIEENLLRLNEQKQQKVFSSSAAVLCQILDEIKDRLKTSQLPGLTSSFPDLDAITQGFHKSDLIILAGRPSMGKTAFSLALAKNIASKFNVGVAFFSLEMTKQQLLYRLLSTETHIAHARLRSSRISKEEWISINKAIDYLSNLPIFIDDSPTLSVSEMFVKLKALKQENESPLGLIFVDYLQLLEEGGQTDNRVQELSKITRGLKKLAREFDVPVIVLSQLSRNVETRTNKRPMLSDLRESGSIEQDADIVMMLYREDYYNQNSQEKNIIEVILSKHRNGPLGVAQLKFDPQYLYFKSIVD